MAAQHVGVSTIDRRMNQISIKFSEKASVDPTRLMQFVANNKGAQFSPNGLLKFNLRASGAEEIITSLLNLLNEVSVHAEQVA
jgi:transcription-repair coupling factor (superfamily II helicase)